jgi:hypothetical protein
MNIIYHKIYKHICRYDEYLDRARYASLGTIEPFLSYSLQHFRESDVIKTRLAERLTLVVTYCINSFLYHPHVLLKVALF